VKLRCLVLLLRLELFDELHLALQDGFIINFDWLSPSLLGDSP
jgi:hypothetical protein